MIYGKKKLLAAMQKPKCRNTEEVNLECLYRVREKKLHIWLCTFKHPNA